MVVTVILILWYISRQKKECSGFQNNTYYFQGNENDSMYNGNLIQPKLIHKINIPREW